MNKIMREMRRKIIWDLNCIDREKYNVYVLAEIFSTSRQSILRDLSKMEDRIVDIKLSNLKDIFTQQIQENVKKKKMKKLKTDFQPSKRFINNKDFSKDGDKI